MSTLQPVPDLDPDTPKYSVRKADGTILEPGTYFVVRANDLFASAGLWAYAHSLETVLELNASRQVLTPEEEAHLRETANHVAELASTWQKAGLGRLPD